MKGQVIPISKRQIEPGPMDNNELKRRWDEAENKDVIRARLLVEARNRGKTQEEIAQVVVVSRQQIQRLLTFAEFVIWCEENAPTGANTEFRFHELSERKFRGFWRKRGELKADVNKRREAVLKDVVEYFKELDRHDPEKFKELAQKLNDTNCVNGRVLKLSTIAEKTGFDVEFVQEFLGKHQKTVSHGMQAERVRNHTWKIHPVSKEKKVSSEFVLSKIREYLDELDHLGKYPVGSHYINPQQIRELVALIIRKIEEI